MDKKQKDRHLDVPAEANRDKHINFIAEERSEIDPREEPSTGPLASETNNTDDPDSTRINKEKKTKNTRRSKT